jgi:hypothetical protein
MEDDIDDFEPAAQSVDVSLFHHNLLGAQLFE